MILIGKKATVVASTNPNLLDLTGEIIEEGKETLRLRTNDGNEKLIVKHTVTLEIEGRVHEGKDLTGTHANRLKK